MLAAAFPGIPDSFPEWDGELKRAWIDNIPYVLAELDYQKRRLSYTSTEGISNAILARTGNRELAEKVKVEIQAQQQLEYVTKKMT